jgi:Putative transposase/Transposase zinc-binding domain
MKGRDPLRQILYQTRPHWDQDSTRPAVRSSFAKALDCRTEALGAEVYASDVEERTYNHTCKSPCCSSCGHRATMQWQRRSWAALPDGAYKGITFTMPDVLWSVFRDNRALTEALPSLASTIIQSRATARYGARIGVVAVLHTFNGKLEFNSHVHTMVTAGGLSRNSGTWIPRVYYDRDLLMEGWKRAVINLLRSASTSGRLNTTMTCDQMEGLLSEQEQRWWSVKIQSFTSRERFLRYAGRYVRRPPIAQRRITFVGRRVVRFWYRDKKLGRRVVLTSSPEEFVDRWAQHVRERYQHASRSFGLFSPRSLGEMSAAVFTVLGQERRPRPKARRWAHSLKHNFGYDPLIDKSGNPMKWVRRIPPTVLPPSKR